MNNTCPQCGSKAYKRNGYTRHGKQNHRCLDCGRQFSQEPSEQGSGQHCLELMEQMINEGITLEGLC